MKVVLQRVSQASVEVAGAEIASIGRGLLVLAGLAQGDTEEDAALLAQKLVHLRIFEDEAGKFQHSLLDCKGQLLVVSQFTLEADTRKGRRPSFTRAMPPAEANVLFETFLALLEEHGIEVQQGQFGAHMKVHLCNDGPVTILLESKGGQLC